MLLTLSNIDVNIKNKVYFLIIICLSWKLFETILIVIIQNGETAFNLAVQNQHQQTVEKFVQNAKFDTNVKAFEACHHKQST